MKINQVIESATVAGSIATVASPLGATQSRSQKPPKAPKVTKGKKYANTLSEGKMKELYYDLQHMDNGNFKKKYGKTKEEMKASLKEEKIAEADLIVVPGMRKSKDKSFIPHKEDRRDHEVEMARSDLYAAAKDAMRIFKLLKDRSEDEGIMGWQQSYITLASDYLNSVADSLEYQMNMHEMTGGVIAGGMGQAYRKFKPKAAGVAEDSEPEGITVKNSLHTIIRVATHLERQIANNEDFPEWVSEKIGSVKDQIVSVMDYEISNKEMQGVAEGRPYNPLDDERREQDAMDRERRDFKRSEMEYELRNEPANNYAVHIDGRSWKVFGSKGHAEAIARKLRMKGKKAEVKITGAPVSEAKAHKCPECGGEMVSEELMNEKKDACYYKVKSRYKVWPSAYASGALVKCRKKGASNWGKSKK